MNEVNMPHANATSATWKTGNHSWCTSSDISSLQHNSTTILADESICQVLRSTPALFRYGILDCCGKQDLFWQNQRRARVLVAFRWPAQFNCLRSSGVGITLCHSPLPIGIICPTWCILFQGRELNAVSWHRVTAQMGCDLKYWR